jgi:hypothetical protein
MVGYLLNIIMKNKQLRTPFLNARLTHDEHYNRMLRKRPALFSENEHIRSGECLTRYNLKVDY